MINPIETPWDEEMTSGSVTFEVFTNPIIKKDEIEMEKRNPFSDSYSPNKESMKGSTMFWWALGVSFYIYCIYTAVSTEALVKKGVLQILLDNNDFRAFLLMMFITITSVLAFVILIWFFCGGGINYINKLLDKILK